MVTHGHCLLFRWDGESQVDQRGILFPDTTAYQIVVVTAWKIVGCGGQGITDLQLVFFQIVADILLFGILYFVAKI